MHLLSKHLPLSRQQHSMDCRMRAQSLYTPANRCNEASLTMLQMSSSGIALVIYIFSHVRVFKSLFTSRCFPNPKRAEAVLMLEPFVLSRSSIEYLEIFSHVHVDRSCSKRLGLDFFLGFPEGNKRDLILKNRKIWAWQHSIYQPHPKDFL